MLAYWPDQIKTSKSHGGLINFSDFYATFCEILGVNHQTDGASMMGILSGKNPLIEKLLQPTMIPCGLQMLLALGMYFLKALDINSTRTEKFFDMENDILETRPRG